MNLFWNTLYWVSCCTTCHNTLKARIERKGKPALDRLAERLGLPVLEEWQKKEKTTDNQGV
jgi:cytochrome c553